MKFTVEWIESAKLKPAPYNPRKDLKPDDLEYRKIQKSINEFGLVDPLVVNKDHTIISGHQRFKVLVDAGFDKVPCSMVDLDKTKEKALNIALNKITGDWDFPKLNDLLIELDTGDLDMEAVGFSADELEALLVDKKEPKDAEPQIDQAEELNKKWKVKPGDLWEIGDHRLLCGDSTKAEDVARVMGGEKADMVFTDPPYGIDRGEGFEGFGGFGKPIARRKHKDGEWDKTRPGKDSFDLILSLSEIVLIFGGNFFTDILPQGNHWLVWDKKNTMPTFGDCELVWTNIKRNSVKKYDFEYNGLIGKEKERFHPTQKPVGLVADMMGDYGKDGELVFDPFLGSGTTMVACENLNRKCRGIEISENYCAVILERMSAAFPNIEIKKV